MVTPPLDPKFAQSLGSTMLEGDNGWVNVQHVSCGTEGKPDSAEVNCTTFVVVPTPGMFDRVKREMDPITDVGATGLIRPRSSVPSISERIALQLGEQLEADDTFTLDPPILGRVAGLPKNYRFPTDTPAQEQ